MSRRPIPDGSYLCWDKLEDLILRDLTSYFHRKNKIVIVKFKGGEKCLTFLVEDVETPQVPGYPASSIEYFDNCELAITEIKRILDKLNYVPKHQEYGFFN